MAKGENVQLSKTWGRNLVSVIAGAAACALLFQGIAFTAANASTSPSAPAKITNSTTKAQDFAYFNARLPQLRKDLAAGDSLPQALQQAGFPPLKITALNSSNTITNGPSCQGLTCGWKFSAATTYEIQYLMWIGEIAGPGGICVLFGGETAGIACALAAGIYAVLSAYAFPVPRYTGKCLYAGIGLTDVTKLEKC
jgi:hypothetical protein